MTSNMHINLVAVKRTLLWIKKTKLILNINKVCKNIINTRKLCVLE